MSVSRRHARVRVLATSSALVLSMALAHGPALAQEDEEDASSQERIVVTGSRIQRQDFEANSPIVTVDTKAFENTSTIGIETVLNQLPQFVPALTQFTTQAVEASAFNTPGASTVSLRGLGAGRNLVLVDGQRAVPVNGSMAVDTNSIPSSAIQRVEIISGGASAVYGADAMSGVVNFILKDDYEGMQFDTQYGVSELGDNAEFRASLLTGANFASGRGNVMFSLEHSTRGKAESLDRDWYREQFMNPNISATEFWFSDTFYAPTAKDNTNRPTQAAVNALFPLAVPCPAGGFDLDNNPATALTPCGTDSTGSVGNTTSFFINRTPDGTGALYTGGRNFGASSSNAGAYKYAALPLEPGASQYGDPNYPDCPWRKRQANNSIGENQCANFLSSPLERYSAFARGRFELTDDIAVTSRVNFARTATDQLLQYSPATGSWSMLVPHGNEIYHGLTINGAVIVPDSVQADGTTHPAYRAGGVYGVNCDADGVAGCTQSEAWPLPPELNALLASRPNPNADVALQRNLDFLPRRSSFNRTTTFEVVLGLEGTLPNDWTWDASLSHGKTEVITAFDGFASLERFRTLVEQTPNFGMGFLRKGNEEWGGFAAGQATCETGLPIIRDFVPSQDCIDAVRAPLQNNSLLEQSVFEANLTGDLFELPAGTLQFALGAGYRENYYKFQTDLLTDATQFQDQAIGLFAAGSSSGGLDVSEVYGELLVPVVSNLPFVRQLELELGGRYSDYSTGGVDTYKLLADWSINDWIRIRGGYNKANRAPNLAELYLARTQNAFGGGATQGDPCTLTNDISPVSARTEDLVVVNPDGTETRTPPFTSAEQAAQTLAICRALMTDTAVFNFYDGRTNPFSGDGGAGSPFFVGNPNLEPETADTYTVGVVLQAPSENPWLSGLRATVDYFSIEIANMIATESFDAVYQDCMGLATNPTGDPNHPSCLRIQRDPITGAGLTADLEYTNAAFAKSSGYDVQINWNAQFDDLGLGFVPGSGVGLSILATIPEESSTQAAANLPKIHWEGTQGCALGMQCTGYDYTTFTTLNYFWGDFSASLRWQHYPPIKSGGFATNPATTAIGVPKRYDLFGLSGSYRLTDSVLIRAGIDNLLDEEPPLAGGNATATPFPTAPTRAGGGTYDPLGRRYFLGLNATF